MGVLEDLVARAGGCAVIDGGFATQLEALGADINDPLWSAACLITRPHLVKEVITALGQRSAGPACFTLYVCSCDAMRATPNRRNLFAVFLFSTSTHEK